MTEDEKEEEKEKNENKRPDLSKLGGCCEWACSVDGGTC